MDNQNPLPIFSISDVAISLEELITIFIAGDVLVLEFRHGSHTSIDRKRPKDVGDLYNEIVGAWTTYKLFKDEVHND